MVLGVFWDFLSLRGTALLDLITLFSENFLRLKTFPSFRSIGTFLLEVCGTVLICWLSCRSEPVVGCSGAALFPTGFLAVELLLYLVILVEMMNLGCLRPVLILAFEFLIICFWFSCVEQLDPVIFLTLWLLIKLLVA